jgi:hypothetical protein
MKRKPENNAKNDLAGSKKGAAEGQITPRRHKGWFFQVSEAFDE